MILTFKPHILCLMETRVHQSCGQICNLAKYSYLSIYDSNELMTMCEKHLHLNYFLTKTNNGSKFKATIFNTNKKCYCMFLQGLFMFIIYIFSTLKILIQTSSEHCLNVVIRDFNVDIVKKPPIIQKTNNNSLTSRIDIF